MRICQICRVNKSTHVAEAEIVLDNEYQLITKVYVCDDCIPRIREFCHHADICADKREGFEEFFFDTSMVRVWFRGSPK